MKSRKMRVIVPALALVLVAAAVAGFFVVRAETETATPAVQWTTFHDYFGLFTMRYPESWTVDGGDAGGAGGLPASEGGEPFLYERYLFTETGHPNEQIEIGATEIANNAERAYFCAYTTYRDGNSTLAGIPVHKVATGGYVFFAFEMANSVFTISLGMPPTDALVLAGAPPPTPLPESQIKTVYNPILATFKPSSSKELAC